MPERETMQRAREDAREGKSPSTQAGEFVREEMDHIREGKHGARSTKQAIAIGLSKARRAGVKLPARGSAATRKKAAQDTKAAKSPHKVSARRSRATESALKREGHSAARMLRYRGRQRRALPRVGRPHAARRRRRPRLLGRGEPRSSPRHWATASKSRFLHLPSLCSGSVRNDNLVC